MKRSKLTPQGPEFSRMLNCTWRLLDTQPTEQKVNGRLLAYAYVGFYGWKGHRIGRAKSAEV